MNTGDVQNKGKGGNTAQERLRIELAINRMPTIIKKYRDEAKEIVQHNASARDDYFIGVYQKMNEEAYRDTHSHTLDKAKAGNLKKFHERERFRKCIINFTHKLFDDNGFPLTFSKSRVEEQHKTTAKYLAEFYIEMRNLKPFEYGNEITLNSFVEYLGNLPAFDTVNASTIDFRRLTHDQAVSLRESNDVAVVASIFEAALNHSLTPRCINIKNEFGVLGECEVDIGGIKFLEHKEGGKEYLVTVNGGLVEKSRVLDALIQHFEDNKSVAEFVVKPEKYLDIDVEVGNTKHKLSSLKVIDGYEVNAKGEAPLICLSANIETGLVGEKHDKLVEYLKKGGHKLHDLHNVEIANRLIAEAPENMQSWIGFAAQHVRNITDQIDQAKDEVFEGKTPETSGHPRLVMSMGGPGSGKGSVADIAAAYTKKNYIEASLDKARNSSLLYHVLKKVGHHSDDYKMIEPFAKSMREWVANKAREGHFNLLYDGTGIDFSPRYDEIAKQFNDSGYKTTVCMVDTMFIVPEERKQECPVPVYERIKGRLEDKGGEQRMLPWRITVDKHRGIMHSFLDAFRSKNVEKVVAFCNDGPPGSAYLLAESFPLEKNEFTPFEHHSGDANGKEKTFKLLDVEGKLKSSGSVTSMLAGFYADKNRTIQKDEYNNILAKIPYLCDKNVAMICDDSSGNNKGLVLTNVTRMVDVAQKSRFNRDAAGPSSVLQCSKEYSFLAPQNRARDDLKMGEVPLQIPPKDYSDAVAQKYQHPSRKLSIAP